MGRLWAQALAISLVMVAGVTTLILAVGAYRSLEETRSAYYERYRFADVFATAKRVPQFVERQILEINGVAAAETRIQEYALLDVEGMEQPATALTLSLPDHRGVAPQRHIPAGGAGCPNPAAWTRVIVNEAFAQGAQVHHGFGVQGHPERLQAQATHRRASRSSPEFIYAIGPGDLVPDDRRFCDMWMSEKALSAIFDLEGAFNSVSVKLLKNASEAEVIKQLDRYS